MHYVYNGVDDAVIIDVPDHIADADAVEQFLEAHEGDCFSVVAGSVTL